MADMIGDSDADRGTGHRDIRPAEMKHTEKNVSQTVSTFENFINPFDKVDAEKLVCISSGSSVTAEIAHDFLHAEQVGLESKETFITERLQKGTGFFEPIKKQNLKTMGSIKKTVKVKTSKNKEIQYSQQGNIAFQLLVKSQKLLGEKLNLRELMTYQLTPVPYSLSLSDGSLNKTDTSKGMQNLLKDCEDAKVLSSPSETLVIEDGNAVFHRLHELPGTFSGIARKILEESVLKSKSPCVFSTDMYHKNSVKAMERQRRGAGERLIVSSGHMKRPKDWKDFLSNDDNKVQLVKILLDTWSGPSSAPVLRGREVILICEGRAYKLMSTGARVTVTELESLNSNQEETDTRAVLYVLYAQEMGYKMARVKTPDTDIFFILLHHAHRFSDLQVIFETGKGRTKRSVDISELAKSYSPLLRTALLGVHAFSGCDSTSAFRSKGKVKPLNLLMKNEKLQAALAELGECWTVSEAVVELLEEFTCLLYGYKHEKKVNAVRHTRLLQRCGQDGKLRQSKKIDLASLPPCQSSLSEHIKRVNYQVGIWKQAHISIPNIPQLTSDHGWTIEDGKFQPKWTGKNVLPVELADILETMDQEETDSDTDEESGNESEEDSDESSSESD